MKQLGLVLILTLIIAAAIGEAEGSALVSPISPIPPELVPPPICVNCTPTPDLDEQVTKPGPFDSPLPTVTKPESFISPLPTGKSKQPSHSAPAAVSVPVPWSW